MVSMVNSPTVFALFYTHPRQKSALDKPETMAYYASMVASHKLSFKFSSRSKMRKITAVLDRYRTTVNAYVRHIWTRGGSLDKATADAVPLGHLTFRMRAHALQQALGIVATTRTSAHKLGKIPSCPVFNGAMLLSKQLAEVTPAREAREFDLWLRFSTLQRNRRIDVPLKATRHLRKLLTAPGALLKGGCAIGGRSNRYWVTVWVESPDLPIKNEGNDIGVDIGLNKLLTTSDGRFYGTEMKAQVDRVRRRKPGSQGKRQAIHARNDYINHTLNQLPYDKIRFLAVEKLRNLKKGKRPNRGKSFRKALAPWTYAFVLRRIKWKAKQNRVRLVEVNPAYTSQICPSCSHRARSSRSNEMFTCARCGYTADADFVGSVNILSRAIGKPMVSQLCGPLPGG